MKEEFFKLTDSANFSFAFLMYRCATDFLARRCRNEECAGFLGEHMFRAALGVKTELFPEWGK